MTRFEANVSLHVAVKSSRVYMILSHSHTNCIAESMISQTWHILHQSSYVRDSIVGGERPGVAVQ